jgi:TPR repeat protein
MRNQGAKMKHRLSLSLLIVALLATPYTCWAAVPAPLQFPNLRQEPSLLENSLMNDDPGVANIRKRAEQGIAADQFKLGLRYYTGKGVMQDDHIAFSWFEKAAEQGNAPAQCYLGYMYKNGQGLRQDYKKALSWFQQSADQGYAQAQCYLGGMYYQGTGVRRDYEKAFSWFQKSAAQGFVSAECILGTLYEIGEGISQDYEKAYQWYSLAAAKDANPELVKMRDHVLSEMSPTQAEEAQAWATNWQSADDK